MRYISDKNISFSIVINDAEKRVRFIPRMQGGSIYLTNNLDEIKELEDSDMFGRVYRRAPGCECEEVPAEKAAEKAAGKAAGKAGRGGKKSNTELTKVEEVTTWQEAAEYLYKNYEIEAEQLTTPESILVQATEKMLSFPNIK